jgi:RNA polymerase sigma factor (sigma-70 family)
MDTTLRQNLLTSCRASATDAQLARRAAAGDDDAFEKLYARYQPRLQAYCRSIVRHDEDARDAVQNAMTKALVALRRDNDTTNVQGWLFRIAHNEAITVLRRRRPTAELHDVMRDQGLGPAGDLLLREELRATLDAVRALPGNLQHPLLLRELAGLSYGQVADVVGGTPAAARKAVFDARTALSADRAGRDEACSVIRQSLSEGDGRRRRARVVRSHLQSCHACCDWEREQRRRRQHLHGLLPAGAAGSIGWLASILGGGSTVAAGISGAIATNAKVAASLAVLAAGAAPVVREVEHAASKPAVTASAQASAASSSPSASSARVATATTTRAATATARDTTRGSTGSSSSRAGDRAATRSAQTSHATNGVADDPAAGNGGAGGDGSGPAAGASPARPTGHDWGKTAATAKPMTGAEPRPGGAGTGASAQAAAQAAMTPRRPSGRQPAAPSTANSPPTQPKPSAGASPAGDAIDASASMQPARRASGHTSSLAARSADAG